MSVAQYLSGKALEDDLARFHATQSAYIQKNHPDVDRGKKGAPDFLALVSGTAILFDAKACKAERWSVHLLKPHQANAFDRFMQAGGIAAIYLRFPSGDRWLPWPHVRERWRSWYTSGKPQHVESVEGVSIVGCNWIEAI
jgi:hypothetical protein